MRKVYLMEIMKSQFVKIEFTLNSEISSAIKCGIEEKE